MNTYRYEDITVGQEESFSVTLTEEKMKAFCEITGDNNPLHTDSDYAVSKGYEGKVAYGMLTASFFSTLAGVYLPGKYSLIHSVEVKFPKPVYVHKNGTLIVRGVVTEKNDLFRLLQIKVSVESETGEKLCRGMMKVGVLDDK
jgi:3-hydroxybutyryl-CoA dehydratase